MTPGELYQAGKLAEAVQAALENVKKNPADTNRRGQLVELLCIAGDLERADKQLDVIGQQDPQAQMGVSMLRQLVRAENARQQFFQEGRVPEFVGEPDEELQLHLQASIAIREGRLADAARNLTEAESRHAPVRGQCNGRPFDDLRDLDDLTSSFFEVLTSNGKYYWIPLKRVDYVEFRAPERPKDLLWRRCQMKVQDGPEGEVFIPALYAGTHLSPDPQLRLGRGTEWIEQPEAPVRGVGQRIYLVGQSDMPILQMQEITIDRPAA
jgi:type VI secretion system protein ImpE